MNEIITIGIDIAKNVFQVHGIDATGEVVVRRQLRRRQVLAFFTKLSACLVGMEACATSHHRAREIGKLGDAAARRKVRALPAVAGIEFNRRRLRGDRFPLTRLERAETNNAAKPVGPRIGTTQMCHCAF